MHDWQSVFKDTNEHRVEIVRAFLEENHIDAVIVNRKVSAYGFGNVELFVSPDHVIPAIKLIKDSIHFE